METILQLSRRVAHNASPSPMDMKYSPTESLKLSSRDNKRIERRKPNWTEAENVFLLDQFSIHQDILTAKMTDASTNLKKQEIWRLICHNLNTHNTLVRRTPAEVRRKWKNLVTAAKKEVWEMRHQMHLSGGAGTNGRKISELSQRVLQLHSSGGFTNANPNGLYGTLLSAGLIAPPSVPGMGGDKYGSKYDDDKAYLPAHLTPIITLSESNNNHINLMESGHSGDGPPSPLSDEDDDESSDSRNATEFMSDSGIYEQEGIDLRVNISGKNGLGTHLSNGSSNRSSSESANNGEGGRRQPIITNGDVLDDEDDDVDCEDDMEMKDMSLIRFASHLGLRHKLAKDSSNNFIANALLNRHSKNARDYNDRVEERSRLLQEAGMNGPLNRKPEITEDAMSIPTINGDLIDATIRMRNHFLSNLKESDTLGILQKERLELQIEVLKLRKQLLSQQLEARAKRIRLNNAFVQRNRMIYRRRRNGLSPFFRLKPKNTWINFAANEKQDQKQTKYSQSLSNGINGTNETEMLN